MSYIPLPSNLGSAKVDTYQRSDGTDTVQVQAMICANPMQAVTGNITGTTSVTATNLADANSALVSIRGTYSAAFVFEGSNDGGTNWFSLEGFRVDNNMGETATGALVNDARAWRLNLDGFDQFRVRCNAFTSGTAAVRILPSPHPVSYTAAYDSVDDMMKIKSLQKKFRDSFPGASVNSANWDVSLGTGGSASVSGGQLTLASGTTANAVTSITSRETFTIPFRFSVGMSMSQRIANQTLFIEAVSVDPLTGIPDGNHSCGVLFDGTTATQAKYRVQNSAVTPLDSAAVTFPTTASMNVFEVEPFSDEVWFHGTVLDSTAGRSNSYRRHQQIPDPNAVYKLRIRWVNGASAPASSTNAIFQYVTCQDYAELTAEITAGRGQTVAGQAIGVAVTSMPTTSVTGSVTNVDNLYNNESVTPQAASATVTGTSRDTGTAAGTAQRYGFFKAFAFADQAGTMRIEVSTDNVTWRRATVDTAVAANTPLILSVPIMARYHRVVYINGATLQTAFMLNTAMTAT